MSVSEPHTSLFNCDSNQRQKDSIDKKNTNIHGNNKSMSGTLLSTCCKMYKINLWYLTYHEMSATIFLPRYSRYTQNCQVLKVTHARPNYRTVFLETNVDDF